MISDTNYPNHINQKLGFEQIVRSAKNKCLTESGAQKLSEITFSTNYDHILEALSLTDEMREILVLDYHFPLSYFEPQKQILQILTIDDAALDIEQVVALRKLVDVLKAVLHFFSIESNQKFVTLKNLLGTTVYHAYVSDRISTVLNAKNEVKDQASSELQKIRQALRNRQHEVSLKVNSIFSKVKQSGWLDSDLSVTMVNGRWVVPIDATHKRKITGLVHDVSATGKTAYIEPAEVLHLNNEIVELEYREVQEIEKILFELTVDLRPYAPDLAQAYEKLSDLDMLRGKALLAIQMQGIKPAVNPEPGIHLVQAKHPILLQNLEKEGRKVVPLNLVLQTNERLVIISGPNAGGKSVALKTVGLLQLMLQHGFLIPVSGSTEMGIFEQIFIDIGDEQSLENDLSTYSSHLLNMKHFIKNAHSKTLILIDEFGTGTEPSLGGAIAEAVLEALNQSQVFGLITTHYTNLKHMAVSHTGLVNAAMMFDTQHIKPLFELEYGQAGSSFAFEIARKIGLPETVLQSASQKIGQSQVDFDKHLRELLRDKKYWNEKRQKIRQDEKRLDDLLLDIGAQAEAIKHTKKQTLSQAKKEAEEILRSANKQVEHTIKSIREAQADKEKTKEIRKEFESFKQQITVQKQSEEEDKILKKIEQIQNRKKQSKKPNKPILIDKILPTDALVIGSKVRISDTETYGEIASIHGQKAELLVGQVKMKVELSRLLSVNNAEYKKNLPPVKASQNTLYTDRLEKKMNFNAYLDLRGQRVEQAINALQIFIDDAISTDTKHLKILHGTGTGALKVAVRSYLQQIDLVRAFKDEMLELGGAGITLVEME